MSVPPERQASRRARTLAPCRSKPSRCMPVSNFSQTWMGSHRGRLRAWPLRFMCTRGPRPRAQLRQCRRFRRIPTAARCAGKAAARSRSASERARYAKGVGVASVLAPFQAMAIPFGLDHGLTRDCGASARTRARLLTQESRWMCGIARYIGNSSGSLLEGTDRVARQVVEARVLAENLSLHTPVGPLRCLR